jgi:hypothetical protein
VSAIVSTSIRPGQGGRCFAEAQVGGQSLRMRSDPLPIMWASASQRVTGRVRHTGTKDVSARLGIQAWTGCLGFVGHLGLIIHICKLKFTDNKSSF